MGALVAILLPFSRNHDNNTGSRLETLKRVDTVGVLVLTGASYLVVPRNMWLIHVQIIAALVLFVFAVTNGAAVAWNAAATIASLVVSVVLGVAFFFWEAYIPEERAAVYVHSLSRTICRLMTFSDLLRCGSTRTSR